MGASDDNAEAPMPIKLHLDLNREDDRRLVHHALCAYRQEETRLAAAAQAVQPQTAITLFNMLIHTIAAAEADQALGNPLRLADSLPLWREMLEIIRPKADAEEQALERRLDNLTAAEDEARAYG